MNIVLVDEMGISYRDAKSLQKALNFFIALVCSAWGKAVPSLSWATNTTGADIVPKNGDWLVYITERNRGKPGVKGHHGKAMNGVIVAYCSLKAVGGNLFGRYHRPLMKLGKTFGVASFMGEGLVTTLAHEIAEMLCDSNLDQYSDKDKNGLRWLVEVCDPIEGCYLKFTDAERDLDCVLPDIVTPAFYKLDGVAPFALAHSVTAPFTQSAKGEAYGLDPMGKLVKVSK